MDSVVKFVTEGEIDKFVEASAEDCKLKELMSILDEIIN